MLREYRQVETRDILQLITEKGQRLCVCVCVGGGGSWYWFTDDPRDLFCRATKQYKIPAIIFV